MNSRTPIFDAARSAKGAGFTQAQVDALNAAFDHAGIPREAVPGATRRRRCGPKRYVDQWTLLTLARCSIAQGHASDVAKSLMGKGLIDAAVPIQA